jgi:hypothetical protein
MNADPAALTARTDRRLSPPRRAFVFHAPLRVAWKAKIKPFEGVPMQQITKHSLFSLGQVVATPGALTALQKAGQLPQEFLARHVQGDWGELCEEDRQENALSLERGFRLLSRYNTSAGEALYVITEADRSVTTLLLPEEY